MNRRYPSLRVGSVLTILALLGAAPARATWSHDPAGPQPVCTSAGTQYAYSSCSDGAGGVFIAWYDNRSGDYDVYAQHLDAHGVAQWTANGVPVAVATRDQTVPVICTDGAGGVFIAWRDFRNSVSDADIYVQHLDPAGAPFAGWPVNGVSPGSSVDDNLPLIAADGVGGAYVAWAATYTITDTDPLINHVTAGGTWWPYIHEGTSNVLFQWPTALTLSGGKAFMAWNDERGASIDLYMQAYSVAGAEAFALGGRQISTGPSDDVDAIVVPDGYGGVIVGYDDYAYIYATRVLPNGNLAWGYPYISDLNSRQLAAMTSDGSGGAILFWRDSRGGALLPADLYATRVTIGGVIPPGWTYNGTPIATAVNVPQLTAVSDGAGGALVTWGGTGGQYIKHLGGNGIEWPGWPYSGRALAMGVGGVSLVTDGAQGAIASFHQVLGTAEPDVFAQRVDRFSQLGEPSPAIASVRDVKNDQGGHLKVSWDASYLDALPASVVTEYDVWRSVPATYALRALATGAQRVDADQAVAPATSDRKVIMTQALGGQTVYWEFVGQQAAAAQAGYSYVVPTLGDSAAATNPYTLVKVRALAASTGAFWESKADSGYSVDNLPPATPAPFSGTYSVGTGASLFWGANAEADLAGYRLYRGSTPGFVPGPSSLVAQKADPGYLDAGAPSAYYKLSAIDLHGNESGFALLLPSGTLAVEDAPPLELALAPVAPNPVRGTARIGYALPRAGRVTLAVFDARGRRVRTLIDGVLEAGRGSAAWDGCDGSSAPVGSGLYFVRLQADGRSLVERLALIR